MHGEHIKKLVENVFSVFFMGEKTITSVMNLLTSS